MPADLNTRQAMFVKEYLVDLNATQAAIRCGYAPGSATVQGARLIANANIATAIQKAMDKRSEKTGITAEFVLEGIKRVTLRCENPIGDDKFEPGAALKGYELLGKHMKLFTEKTEVSGPNGGPIQTETTLTVANLTDDQLRALASIPLPGG